VKLAAVMLMWSAAMAQGYLVEGKADSPVQVVIFEDLQCSDCAAFRRMLDEKLLPKYGARVAFEHRDFPLPKHAWSRDAAIASRHFMTTGPAVAIDWRRSVLSRMNEITKESFRAFLRDFAKRKGLDSNKAVAALDDPSLTAFVQKEFEDGVARGIAKTPTVLVNGEPFIETFTVEEISKSIEGQLAGSGVK
jgi:protein-disulfide isomerase